MNTDVQIERWSVDRLIPYARNARTHSPEQVAQIAASIAEFGWTNPILIGADGVVIAGHARLLAARKLGMSDVPVTRQLNRYINLPEEWTSKPTSGFDTFIIEGFQYAGLDRNIDHVRSMAAYPFEVLSWPRTDCRYLMGHFNAGWPWQRDFLAAQRARTPLVKLWAYDHLCLFSRDLSLPAQTRTHR